MEKTRKKIRPIARKRRNLVYLLLTFLFAISCGYILLNFSPDYKFKFANLEIPILPIFLVSLCVLIYSALTFILIKKTQGVILSLLITSYLGLRIVGLTHWIFAFLFIALFITSEIFILKKK